MPFASSSGGVKSSGDIAPNSVESSDILDDEIVNADLDAAAGIVDTKLATISTAGKVSGAALTSLSSIPSGAGVIPSANIPATLTDDMLKVITVDLTVSNITTMFDTPVVLIAAPGAGKMIVVDEIVFKWAISGTNGNGGDIRVQYQGEGTNILSSVIPVSQMQAGYDWVKRENMAVRTDLTAAEAVNKSIDITNATQAMGTSGGTFKTFIKYRILTV